MTRPSLMRTLLCLLVLLSFSLCSAESSSIPWRDWEGAKQKAQAENKLVLLNLEAVWCHWCHVMAKTTYRDPEVLKLLKDSFVTVKVDQDARPDLSNRYQDYGWPATIIFDNQGRELARLSGYQNPERFKRILNRLLENPEPLTDGPEFQDQKGPGQFTEEFRSNLSSKHFRFYDEERGAWGRIHKFINAPVVEYCLSQSLDGDERNRKMAVQTLDANLQLIDPIWGGVYQYSDSGRWDSPHFEKIMSTQAGNLKVYSLAYSQFASPRYLQAAEAIADYLLAFLKSEEGGFFASQDADLVQGQKASDYFELDDQARRKLGMPRIDRHRYARETGMAAEALAIFSTQNDNPKYLLEAENAGNWLVEKRQTESGGFYHEQSSELLFLGDTLYTGRAFLALYRCTADPKWLRQAQGCGQFIALKFGKSEADGYFTSTERKIRNRIENVDLARFAKLLYVHTGEEQYLDMARRALAYFAIKDVTDFFNPGGILLADKELSAEFDHITIVGQRSSELAQELFRAATGAPKSYLRVDFWEPGTPLPPFSGVEYPQQNRAAAYVCSQGRCSAPIFSVKELQQILR